jgi:hypothetical protein
MRPRVLSRMLAVITLLAMLATSGVIAITAQASDESQIDPQTTQDNSASGNATITLPAGTKIHLALTSPVWTQSVKVGADVYSITAFPVASGGAIAIPAGTYAQGTIDALTLPSWFSSHAAFQIRFSKLIFANGYAVELPAGTANTEGTAVAMAYVNVARSSDIMLDNGSQLELVLQSSLSLNAKKTAEAARVSKPVQLSQFKSATRCRPTAGTAGSPDTVIPGSSGTPDTVIPGGPGMPDIVIPGSPPTPPTVIPGSPGTPGTTCPGPPIVTSTPSSKDGHTESFELKNPVSIAGQTLAGGKYQVTWLGLGPTASVEILQKDKTVAHTQARILTMNDKASANDVGLHTNADGSVSLASLQFKGKTLQLVFDK